MKQCKAIGCSTSFRMEDTSDFCLSHRTGPGSAEREVHIEEKVIQPPTAAEFLRAGLSHMDERALQHDAPDGERSIPKTVRMFNILTGHSLTDIEGWKFMALLKLVRSEQGEFNPDDYEDGASFMALAGEAHAKEDATEWSD